MSENQIVNKLLQSWIPTPGKGAKEREHGIDRREEEEEVQEGNTGGHFIRGQWEYSLARWITYSDGKPRSTNFG